MKISIVFFLVVVQFSSLVLGQINSSENEKSSNTSPDNMSNIGEKSNIETKAMEKNFHALQRQSNKQITPDLRLITNSKPDYGQLSYSSPAVPYFGFSNFENQRQNIYLSDHVGKYNLQLENFQPEKPSNFQVALGALSAHIANQRNNQEYIPYPPNGEPHNYPAYRGHSRSVVRAYERATTPNYGVQPVNFEQLNPRRIFPNSDYKTGFSGQFPNPGPSFYNEPNLFRSNGYHNQFRRDSEPVNKPMWFELEEEYRRPLD